MKSDELNDPHLTKYIVDTIRDPLLVLDESLKIAFASKNFYRDFIVSEKETIGQFLYELGNGQWKIPELITLLQETLTENKVIDNYEIGHDFSQIGKKVMLLNARKVINPDNYQSRILLSIEDITEKKNLENQLVILATTDPLTGLFNRHKFYEILDDRIQISKRNGQITALLSLDLDYFKNVNDNFGHMIGDNLLKAVSHIIKTSIRATDTPARIGGDEFAIIVFNPYSLDELIVLVKRIIDRVSKPIIIQGCKIQVGISIGISLCPDHTMNSTELFKLSDKALYTAKEQGRNQFYIYEKSRHTIKS